MLQQNLENWNSRPLTQVCNPALKKDLLLFIMPLGELFLDRILFWGDGDLVSLLLHFFNSVFR